MSLGTLSLDQTFSSKCLEPERPTVNNGCLTKELDSNFTEKKNDSKSTEKNNKIKKRTTK